MSEREFEIGFGTTFMAKGLPNRKHVVIITEGGGWFISSTISESSTGTEYLSDGPTGNPQDIQKILGQLSYDEIINLAEEGARQQGYELSPEDREILKEHSERKPKQIRISSD